eukprot:5482222-Pleurochrysis_carterae.AAC.1
MLGDAAGIDAHLDTKLFSELRRVRARARDLCGRPSWPRLVSGRSNVRSVPMLCSSKMMNARQLVIGIRASWRCCKLACRLKLCKAACRMSSNT